MEEQLNAMRKEADTLKHSLDKSKIFEAHKQEIQALKVSQNV